MGGGISHKRGVQDSPFIDHVRPRRHAVLRVLIARDDPVGVVRLRDPIALPLTERSTAMDLDYPLRTHGARPQTGRAAMNQPSREEAAESLREQAEACRRLARKARTWAGSCALGAV